QPGFPPAFNQTYIARSFQHPVMSNSFFSMLCFGKDIHDLTLPLVAAYMSCNGAAVVREVAPRQCNVPSLYSMGCKLAGQTHGSYFIFRQYQQTGGILIYTMHQS